MTSESHRHQAKLDGAKRFIRYSSNELSIATVVVVRKDSVEFESSRILSSVIGLASSLTPAVPSPSGRTKLANNNP